MILSPPLKENVQMLKTYYEYFMQNTGNLTIPLFKEINRRLDNNIDAINDYIFVKGLKIEALRECFPNQFIETENDKMFYAVLFNKLYHQWKDKNYFDLSKNLINKLLISDINDINTKYVQCPFRSMYISLPNKSGLLYNNSEEVKAIFLTYTHLLDDNNIYDMQDNKIEIQSKRLLNLLYLSDFNNTIGSISTLPLLDTSIKKTLINFQELDLNNTDCTDVREANKYLDIFVLKLILYINCSNLNIRDIIGYKINEEYRLLKSNKKIKRLKRKYNKHSSLNHKYIDTPILPHNNSVSKGIITNRKNLPHSVRGHFKQQHFGYKLSEIKTIWIEPYERGELGDTFINNRIYKVG